MNWYFFLLVFNIYWDENFNKIVDDIVNRERVDDKKFVEIFGYKKILLLLFVIKKFDWFVL